jgi:hypothetical protein
MSYVSVSTRLDGHHIYWLVISGIMFNFYVGSNSLRLR